jgi:hypothetical protein
MQPIVDINAKKIPDYLQNQQNSFQQQQVNQLTNVRQQ